MDAPTDEAVVQAVQDEVGRQWEEYQRLGVDPDAVGVAPAAYEVMFRLRQRWLGAVGIIVNARITGESTALPLHIMPLDSPALVFCYHGPIVGTAGAGLRCEACGQDVTLDALEGLGPLPDHSAVIEALQRAQFQPCPARSLAALRERVG